MRTNRLGTTRTTRWLLAASLVGITTAPLVGDDITVGTVNGLTKWGTIGDVTAYTFGTTICNVGDAPLSWVANTSAHPVIVHNVHRLRDGRLEMIGMSWVVHGFCALQQSFCGPCTPAGGGCAAALGAGCADVLGASYAGTQQTLSPRSQIDPVTVAFPFPFTAPPFEPVVGRRVRIDNADLDPALNDDAVYFVEAIALHAQDAAAGLSANNLTVRPLVVGSPSGGGWSLTFGNPAAQHSALHAWASLDPTVQLESVDVEGDGRFLVASRVEKIAAGQWQYEYAVMNVNSDRALGSFTVTGSPGATPTEIAFHGIAHHSGEPYSSDAWTDSVTDGAISWSTTPFDVDPNANALRWGVLFNYRFVADTAPVAGVATLGLFKPGDAPNPVVAVLVPSDGACAPADLNCDGVVDGADLGLLLNAWGKCAGCPADLNGDGVIDGADLGILLQAWR